MGVVGAKGGRSRTWDVVWDVDGFSVSCQKRHIPCPATPHGNSWWGQVRLAQARGATGGLLGGGPSEEGLGGRDCRCTD